MFEAYSVAVKLKLVNEVSHGLMAIATQMTATDAAAKRAHANRVLLNDMMQAEGFRRNPTEWWHFSRGDQLAVWIDREKAPRGFALYGRADAV